MILHSLNKLTKILSWASFKQIDMNSVSCIYKFELASSFPEISSHKISYYLLFGAIMTFSFYEYSNPL